ncbi:MAG: tetratricopeptide repeat protein [Candidatus Thorarchaeota archaeon]|nr:tetratricopeptide repeat protein [Candidatus Thorarchaeota archaeon]
MQFVQLVRIMSAKEWFEQGRNSVESGKLEKAIEEFNQATALEPTSFKAWWALGSVCNLFATEIEATGDYARANMYKIKAAYSFDRAVRADPSHPDAEQAKAYADTIRRAQKRKKDEGLIQ